MLIFRKFNIILNPQLAEYLDCETDRRVPELPRMHAAQLSIKDCATMWAEAD